MFKKLRIARLEHKLHRCCGEYIQASSEKTLFGEDRANKQIDLMGEIAYLESRICKIKGVELPFLRATVEQDLLANLINYKKK